MNKNYTSVFVDQEVISNHYLTMWGKSTKSKTKEFSSLLFSIILMLLISFNQTSVAQNTSASESQMSSSDILYQMDSGDIAITTLRADYCGVLVSPIDNIYPAGIVGATGYKFNIYDASGTMLVQSVENSYSRFRFAQINFEYGATYQVKVQVKVGSEYGAEGAACAVTLNAIPETTIVPSQCGATVGYLDNIFPVGIIGATGYIFNIYDASGTTLVASIENSYSRFRFYQFAFQFNTTYQVKVQVRSGNAVGEEGAACSITTQGIPTTTLIDSQCDQIVYTVDKIYPIGITGSAGYRFNIYDQTGNTLVGSIDSNTWFKFTQINFVVGSYYQVKVQVKYGNVYGVEGAACLVKVNEIPTTSIVSSQCGQTVNYLDNIYPIGVTGATGYRYNIYDGTGTTFIASVDSESYFRFAQINFEFGERYQVRVQVKRGSFIGLEGPSCMLLLEGFPTTTIVASQCGQTVGYLENIYPIGITDATGYKFNIYDATGNTLLASIDTNSFFRFAQFNFDFGATYQVKVQVKRGSAIGLEGSACIITLENIPTTSIQTSQCGQVVGPIENIYPTGITAATGYRFNIYDVSGTTLLATIDSNSRFRFSQFAYSFGTTYQVRVQVKRGSNVGVEGPSCNLTVGNNSIGGKQGTVAVKDVMEFKAIAYPNPYSENFNLSLTTDSSSMIQIQVYDMIGKLLEDKKINSSEIQNLILGNQYPTGVYNVIVIQDNNVQTVRVIKR